jgi:hypothetical protein
LAARLLSRCINFRKYTSSMIKAPIEMAVVWEGF